MFHAGEIVKCFVTVCEQILFSTSEKCSRQPRTCKKCFDEHLVK